MLPWWPDVMIVQSDITIIVPWHQSTGSIHDYIFCYCPLVGILFEVLRIQRPEWTRLGITIKLGIEQLLIQRPGWAWLGITIKLGLGGRSKFLITFMKKHCYVVVYLTSAWSLPLSSVGSLWMHWQWFFISRSRLLPPGFYLLMLLLLFFLQL